MQRHIPHKNLEQELKGRAEDCPDKSQCGDARNVGLRGLFGPPGRARPLP